MKVCSLCKVEKEIKEFYKEKYSWCKECCRHRTREHSKKNPEKVKATREKRRDKALAQAREYKEKNKEKLRKKQKVYYLENAQMLRDKSKEYAKNATEEQKKRREENRKKWDKTEAGIKCRQTRAPIARKKYAKHRKASRYVTNAVRDGRMIKPENCSFCGSKENIEGHHSDYDKPLEVIWLCRKCHRDLHKSLKER